MSSQRTQINLKQLKLSSIGSSDEMRVLILGPSISRKNACIQDILAPIWGGEEKIVVHTTHEEFWSPKAQLIVTSNIGKAIGSDISVIENPESFNVSLLEDALTNGTKTIVALNDYSFRIPKSLANKLTHVLVLGGVQGLRSLWDNFGALVPKFRDFRQIYLACTDEGDRYSDDFFIIRVDSATKDPNQVLFWGSLRRVPAKNITMEIERSVVLNKVHTAETVQIPKRGEKTEEKPVVIEEKPAEPAKPTEQTELVEEKTAESTELVEENPAADDNGREPRDDCVIL